MNRVVARAVLLAILLGAAYSLFWLLDQFTGWGLTDGWVATLAVVALAFLLFEDRDRRIDKKSPPAEIRSIDANP
jgi:hypothetical protein